MIYDKFKFELYHPPCEAIPTVVQTAKKKRYACHICGIQYFAKTGPLQKTQDHVIPKSKGGSLSKTNILPAHAICNVAKGNNLELPNEFTNQLRKLISKSLSDDPKTYRPVLRNLRQYRKAKRRKKRKESRALRGRQPCTEPN